MLARISTGVRAAILLGILLGLGAILVGCVDHLPPQKEGSLPDRITPTLLSTILTDTPASPATVTLTPTIPFTATAALSATETPQPTATVPATINPCPIGGPPDMTALAVAQLVAQAEQCSLSMPPLENYQWGTLGGYTLTYPQEWRAQVSEDGSGGMMFEDKQYNLISVIRTQTDLPLNKIEQSNQEYEFISLPLVNKTWEQTIARQVVTLDRRSVVMLNTQLGDNHLRRYFLRSEQKPGGRYDLFVFQVMKYGQPIAEFPDLVAEIESLVKSFQFLPPNTPPLARPAAPDLPVAPVRLPVGVLVDHPTEGEGWLKVLSPQGQPLGALSPARKPTWNPMHAISPFTGEINQLVLAAYDETPRQGQEVYVSQGGTITQTISAPFVAWLGAAPGQPVIAYTTIGMRSTYNDSRLYLGRTADFPMDPVIKIDWSSGNPYPYAVYARGGRPQGVWFTYRPYGIGGFVYALDNELRYYDTASKATRLILPGVGISGLSPDYSHVAYNIYGAKSLMILNLVNRMEINFPMAADCDRSGAYARFSSDNRYVAWMEGSGYPEEWATGAPPFHSRLRVAALDTRGEQLSGEMVYDFQDVDFSQAAGYAADWVQPVGWLDKDNLLVQISKLNVEKTVLLLLNVQDASISLFSEGTFVDFAYAP